MTDKTPQPGTDPARIRAELARTWVETILGIATLGALIAGALYLLGFHFGVAMIVLGLTAVFPIVSWYMSADMVKKLMRCYEPDSEDPDHARLIAIMERLYPKTGLPVKPPLYVSPMPIANAFATGRSPRNSFIAVTEGLLHAELTDAELEAVIAHELAHVKTRDAGITSMMAAMGSIFSILVATGFPWMFKSVFINKSKAPLLDKLAKKVDSKKKKFVDITGGFLGLVFVLMVFYVVSVFTKLITLFVSRARESSADAYAALWTDNPCALSTALQKLVVFEHKNGGNYRMMILLRGLTPLLFINAFNEDGNEDGDKVSFGRRIRNWWVRIGQQHPPVSERLKALDKLSGNACPRL